MFEETNLKIYWCVKGDTGRCEAEANITFNTPINLDIGLFKHQWLFYYFSGKLNKFVISFKQQKFQWRDF